MERMDGLMVFGDGVRVTVFLLSMRSRTLRDVREVNDSLSSYVSNKRFMYYSNPTHLPRPAK